MTFYRGWIVSVCVCVEGIKRVRDREIYGLNLIVC